MSPGHMIVVSIRCLRALTAVVLFAGLAAIWCVMPRPTGKRISRVAFTCLLFGFGIRVSRTGNWEAASGLFIANHVSWTDIPVLGLVTSAGFVAKKEVQDWPVIGALAKRYGCLFINRERRTAVGTQAKDLKSQLLHQSVVLFPEGTTGDGSRLLPFRSSLIATADADELQCVPISIAYRWSDGQRLGSKGWALLAWVGDADLLTHAFRLALAEPILVNVHAGAPVQSSCRKYLARALEDTINVGLGNSYGH